MQHYKIRMPLNIRDEETNQLAGQLAARQGLSKTDAVKIALRNELRRLDEAVPLRERLRAIQQRIRKRPATGLAADKAFYDELSDER
jgi:antitoxin VapB